MCYLYQKKTMKSEILVSREWRYAVKKYDKSKNIEVEDLELILKAINLAPTSYGLQPFKIIHVKGDKVRAELKTAAYNQGQITDASDLLVFAHATVVHPMIIDRYFNNLIIKRKPNLKEVESYKNRVTEALTKWPEAQQAAWCDKQMYIAMSYGLQAASDLRIDSSAIEGFDQHRFAEILKINTTLWKPTVSLTLGYRSKNDSSQHLTKVRLSENELIYTFE
ncbi:MAG: NAD(P)H-dependent oxidoreductase [Flavobacteriaceae bacterium]|nr:NAD(P)H-dependent oxidoreductase [Flavobacteriaceae bacterium]